MSVFASLSGSFDTEQTILTTTSATGVLTADEGGTSVVSVHVAEVSGTGTTVILERFDGTTAYKLTGAVSIAANGRLDYIYPFKIERGWTLRATAGAANRLHVTVNYLTTT